MTAMIGTMMMPPICWATRGSLTRALTMTPATTDDNPTAGPSTKTPISHDESVTTPNRAGPYTSEREPDEHEIGQPSRPGRPARVPR